MSKTTIFVCAILAINIITLLLYVVDKRKAINGKWRIPERVLLSWSFLAPWGGFAGMKLAHHKTKHRKFTILVPVFMVFHIALAVYLIYQTI